MRTLGKAIVSAVLAAIIYTVISAVADVPMAWFGLTVAFVGAFVLSLGLSWMFS